MGNARGSSSLPFGTILTNFFQFLMVNHVYFHLPGINYFLSAEILNSRLIFSVFFSAINDFNELSSRT